MIQPIRKSDPEFVEFDWTDRLVMPWQPGRQVAEAEVWRPNIPNGYYLECTTAGMTAAREPAWPATEDETARDGSVIWTQRNPADVVLPTITSATYTVTPDGVTQSNAAISGLRTKVKLDASAVDVGEYSILAEIIVNGEDVSASQDFEVIE